MRRKILERDVEKYLVQLVHTHGGRAYKFTSPARRSVPDRIIIWPGGVVHFVEVKTLGGTLSVGQKREIAYLRSLGQKVFVLWTKEGIRKYIAEQEKDRGSTNHLSPTQSHGTATSTKRRSL